MPWIPHSEPPTLGKRGGEQPRQQYIRCDKCSSATKEPYWPSIDSREQAGVFWPQGQQEKEHSTAWCPSCAIRESGAAEQSYDRTGQFDQIADLMRERWTAPPAPGHALPPAPSPGPAAAKPAPSPGPAAAKPPQPPRLPPSEEMTFGLEARIVCLDARVFGLEERIVGLEERIGGLLAMIERLDTKVDKVLQPPGGEAQRPGGSSAQATTPPGGEAPPGGSSPGDDAAWGMVGPGDDQAPGECRG